MAIKTVTDPVKGQYDLFVTDGNVAAGAVLPGATSIVGGVVTASLGGTTFAVSGSGWASTVLLPSIDAAALGKSARVMADTAAVTVTASNGLVSSSGGWTASVAAYTTKEYVAVSGALGYYWHAVI